MGAASAAWPCWAGWARALAALFRCSARASSSCAGRPSRANRRSKRWRLCCASCGGAPAWGTRCSTFMRACKSAMPPERKASRPRSLVSAPAVRKVEMRASASGTAQGSPRWSAWRSSSTRRMSRPQSRAPPSSQADCTRARSAASTSTPRHCCHMAAAASVATSATVSMAASSAAPRCAAPGRETAASLAVKGRFFMSGRVFLLLMAGGFQDFFKAGAIGLLEAGRENGAI